MDEFSLRILRREVQSQCQYILRAEEVLNAAFVAASGPPDHTIVWMNLQTILVSAANLSKMCWGSRGGNEEARRRREEARRPLREALRVADDSPLRDPDLRNDFEHFDERVEEWAERPDRGGFVGRNISFGPVHFSRPEERFHHFDLGTGVVSFWEHAVSIPAVTDEVRRVLARCEELERKERQQE